MSDIRAQEQRNPSENSFDKHMKSCFWTLLQKRFQKTRWKCWCESGCKIRTPCFGKKMEHNIRIKKAWSLKRMFNNTNKVIRKDYCILSHYSSNWILIRMMWLVSRWGTLLPPGTVCSMATVRNSRLPGESRRGRWVGDIWKQWMISGDIWKSTLEKSQTKQVVARKESLATDFLKNLPFEAQIFEMKGQIIW